MDLLEKTKHPSRLMDSQHHLNSTISFRLSSSYLRVCDMVACFGGMGCFWCWQWCSLMRMLHLFLGLTPWAKKHWRILLAIFYIPKSVNNLLKAWLIILLAHTSYVPKSKQFGFSIMTALVSNSYVPGSVNNLLKQWLILLAILPSETMKNNLLKFILKNEEESMGVRSCSHFPSHHSTSQPTKQPSSLCGCCCWTHIVTSTHFVFTLSHLHT